MSGMNRLLIVPIMVSCLLLAPVTVQASRKATDMMSEALRQRAAGNYAEAISGFEYAIESTASVVQRHLAKFMLGDCQLESGRFADAAITFRELSESVTTQEEKAEALYRLMQAESGLGNNKRVTAAFAVMRREHQSSPYYELARSFVKSEGLRDEAQSAREVVSAPQQKIEEKPSAVARPLVERKVDKVVTEKKEPIAVEIVKKPQKLAVTEEYEEAPVIAEPEAPLTPAVSKTVPNTDGSVNKKKQPSDQIKADRQTATILKNILKVETAADNEKEELAGKIIGLQDNLKDGPEKNGMDKHLFELAQATAKFGELLEACKTYDQILTHHPTSPLVEKAYYQAIRLRAVLGVHQAVIGWAKAFMVAFPASEYRRQILALVEYSQAHGLLDLSAAGKEVAASKPDKSGSSASVSSGNAALLADSEYVSASRKMKDGRYNLALHDFNRLSLKYAGAPQIWWDVALVNVQLEDFKQAKIAIDKMLALDAGNQDANSLAGYINYRLENFAEAATAYDKAGEPEGKGVNFFDAKTASERMKKSAGK